MITNQTREAYAQVTRSDGTPANGIHVDLALTVAPENDGQLYSAHVGAVSPNGCSTGADGRLNFAFKAQAAGGVHTITATCTGLHQCGDGDDHGAGVLSGALDRGDDLSNIWDTTDEQKQWARELESRVNGYGSRLAIGVEI